MFEKQIEALSDFVVDNMRTSPGNGAVWSFTDSYDRWAVVRMEEGGNVLVFRDKYKSEITRIPIAKVMVAIPFAGTEIIVRYILSRVWRAMAANRLRRDMIKAEWHQWNLEHMDDLLKYGVVVAQRPEDQDA